MRDLLVCPHCGTIFLKPTQGQPAQCHWRECAGAQLRKATAGDLAAWSFGKTIQEPRNEPPRLPYRCGTSLLGMSDDFAAKRGGEWTAIERRHIAWVRAHLMPRPEWLQCGADLDQAGLDSPTRLLVAPTGFGKTSAALRHGLGLLRGGRAGRLLYLTGKGTGGGFDYSLGATYNITPKLSIGATYVGVEGNSFKNFSDDTVVATLKLTF